MGRLGGAARLLAGGVEGAPGRKDPPPFQDWRDEEKSAQEGLFWAGTDPLSERPGAAAGSSRAGGCRSVVRAPFRVSALSCPRRGAGLCATGFAASRGPGGAQRLPCGSSSASRAGPGALGVRSVSQPAPPLRARQPALH